MSTGTRTSLTVTSEVLIPAMIAERVSATARPGSKLGLVINNADNELIAYLNTEQVYDRKTEGDPTFNDSVDLSSRLKHGQNSFVILGVNWGGPAHFVGQLTLDGKVLLSMTFGLPSTPNGVCGLVGRRNNSILTPNITPISQR
jgi:hypothetical protein